MQYSLRKRCHAHKKVDVSTQFLGCHFSLREDYIFFRRFFFTALLIFTSFIWLYTVRFNMRSRVRGAGVSGVSVWDNGGDWFYRWSQSNVFTHRHLLLVQIVRRCTSCRYCYFWVYFSLSHWGTKSLSPVSHHRTFFVINWHLQEVFPSEGCRRGTSEADWVTVQEEDTMFLDDTCDASNRKLFVLAPLWYPFSSSRVHCNTVLTWLLWWRLSTSRIIQLTQIVLP